MGKYLIVNLFNEPIKSYHNAIVSDLEDRFSVKPQKIGAHMTLIPPFESDDVSALVKYTDLYAKTHKRMPVKVGGIGSFRDNVIYLNIEMALEANKTLEQYMEKASTLFVSKETIVTPHVFHCTLVSRRISKKFDEIMSHLKSETLKYETFIDNLTLMKWEDEDQSWRIERQYHFHP